LTPTLNAGSFGEKPLVTTDRPQPPDGDWLGTPYLQFERRGPIAVCTVDRPDKRNAMTPAMYFGVRYAVDHVNRSDELVGLLITGRGDVFIPGGDLSGDNRDGWTDLPKLLGMDNTPFETIRNSAKPVVCAVNGIAQGGGLMIAMLADVTVAADTASFRSPELLRGIADTNYGQLLPRQIGPARARDMLLTGRTVTATEALEWGLVSRVVPVEQLMEEATAALVACCRAAPRARAAVKRVMDDFYGHYDRMSMDASLAGPEVEEGYLAFKDRRTPSWVHPDLDELAPD
jgi:enoyl-CoA hydratase